ncbi:SusD/RagB family nutrient-binding outer membrane lipoprotein [Pinibacter soli]|uniref:SusD/RagB family nutrient-binding outer membrane lipoprotein n=1 Tax=Pinibacter soli TaxID=3044211 RepID=A0ABT6R783_9BACT|nr:SusD/RagB family nutrient-binding outer membrane lipoprotein [Pinibacter soli]MDI3318429.1 SusD/RagB family nutrient-binding outer membrane lipoprotein [Pinibacter soli]
MKKYINRFVAIAACSTLLASCSKKVMDKINENPNNPQDVSSKFILTDVMTSTAFNITGSDYAFYSSVYMELNAGVYSQMYDAEMRNGEPSASSTYNNTWGNQYENLYELKIARQKCGPNGVEKGNYTSLGIAQVLTGYNLAILTDLMGDVPYSEALQPGVIFQPKLDKQQALYDTVFALLDSAIINLGKTNTCSSTYLIGTQDLIYKGKASSWQKAAYGLKARYLMRLSFRNPNYQAVIDNIANSFTTSAEDFQFGYDGSSSQNPFYSLANDRWYFGSSKSLDNKLLSRKDPRDKAFFDFDPASFAPNGNVSASQSLYGGSVLISATAPTYLQSYHEIQFLKAEAYARLNDLTNAELALKNAISAAFVKVHLSTSSAQSYYASSVKPLFDANPLKEIMNQKYLAFYDDEGIEAYDDYRRLKAMGNDFITLENPLNQKGMFPLRFTYGSDDVSANKNIREAYGDGTYVYSQPVWWAGGSR